MALEGLHVGSSSLCAMGRMAVLARENSLAAIFAFREAIETGGLAPMGQTRWACGAKGQGWSTVFSGAQRPSTFRQPIAFELLINLTTAKALSLTIPTSHPARPRGRNHRVTSSFVRHRLLGAP